MWLVSYQMLIDEIAAYPVDRRERAVAAVEAVIAHGGGVRNQNNWCGYWDKEERFNLYYQSESPQCNTRNALMRSCNCMVDFIRCYGRDCHNLCRATFYDWNPEPLESYGLF